MQTPECSFVVDTGTDFRTQALRENIRQVDAVIFTHSHTDHIMGFDDLRRFRCERGGRCRFTLRPKRWRDLERVYEFAFKTLNPFPGYLKPEPHIICWPVSTWRQPTITPLPVPHGKLRVNGYLFSRDGMKLVAYLSDCSARAGGDRATDRRACKLLMIDALRHKPHPTHLSVAQAWKSREGAAGAETYFTHICHELPQAAEAELPPHVGIRLRRIKTRTSR